MNDNNYKTTTKMKKSEKSKAIDDITMRLIRDFDPLERHEIVKQIRIFIEDENESEIAQNVVFRHNQKMAKKLSELDWT